MAVPPRSTPATTSTVLSSSPDVYAAQLNRIGATGSPGPDSDGGRNLNGRNLRRLADRKNGRRETYLLPVGNYGGNLDFDTGGIFEQAGDLNRRHRRVMTADNFPIDLAELLTGAEVFVLVYNIPIHAHNMLGLGP